MMTLTVAQFKAIVLILTLVVAMGCSGGRVEEQSEVGESLGLHSDESGEHEVENAVVYVPNNKRNSFLKKIEDYVQSEPSEKGTFKNHVGRRRFIE